MVKNFRFPTFIFVISILITGCGVSKTVSSKIPLTVKFSVSRSGEIYLLRGLANVFSRGMDSFAEKLQKKGYNVSVHNHGSWHFLAEEIFYRAKRKEISYPDHYFWPFSGSQCCHSHGQLSCFERCEDCFCGYV